MAFDNFCTIENRNEYSTKPVLAVSLQSNYVSTLPGKTKNSTKTAIAYCSAFCWTESSFYLLNEIQQ